MICETVPKDPTVIVDLGDMEKSPKVGEYLQHCPCCLWLASVLVTPVCLSLLLIDPRVFSSLSSVTGEYCSGNITEIIDPRSLARLYILTLSLAVTEPGGASLF